MMSNRHLLMMMVKGIKVIFIFILLGNSVFSQVHDAGLWLGVNGKLALNKRFSLSLSQQVRFDQSLTHFDQYFVQPAISYGKKGIKVGVAYRLAIRAGLPGSTSLRHRYHVNLGYKYGIKKFSLSTRLRYQQVVNPIRGHERLPNGSEKMTFRHKFGVTYSKLKKTKPFFQFEYSIPLNVSEPTVSRLRYRFGVSLDLKKKQKITLFYTLQNELLENQPNYSHTLGIVYFISRKIRKKK